MKSIKSNLFKLQKNKVSMDYVMGGNKGRQKECTSDSTIGGSGCDTRWDSGEGTCDYDYNTDCGSDCPPPA